MLDARSALPPRDAHADARVQPCAADARKDAAMMPKRCRVPHILYISRYFFLFAFCHDTMRECHAAAIFCSL